MRRFKIEQIEKDYFNISISGLDLGRFERSDVRHLIEVLDNTINVGL